MRYPTALLSALSVLLSGCAYDMESWQSPLASGFDGTPDAAEGERIFNEEHWEDESIYALSCINCHHNAAGDTLDTDEGDLNRPGHTVYNAAWRGEWKNGERWSKAKSDLLGAFGGQICVDVYFPGDSEMTPEQAAHLEAYLKTLTDEVPSEDDPRAQPLGIGYSTWDTQSAFLAEIGDRTGPDLGDIDNGALLVDRHCGSCHDTAEDGSVEFYTAATLSTDQLISRIRRTTVDGEEHHNGFMPRLPENRLVDADLKDVLAFLTATPRE